MKIKEHKKIVIAEFTREELVILQNKIATALRTIGYGSYHEFQENIFDFLIHLRDDYIKKLIKGINHD